MAVYRVTQDMGLTHVEFFTTLPAAIAHREYWVEGNVVRIEYEGRYVLIELGCEQVRKIALLRLPHTEVTFSFHHFTTEQRDAFMARFDLYFRRGGG